MMSDRLAEIIAHKRIELEKVLPRAAELKALALERNEFRSFAAAINQRPDGMALIAEVKKASPSVGVISTEFDPVAIGQIYDGGGAHAISVLTDERFFQGHLDYLTAVRSAVRVPCLRKDFTVHEAQIFEASAAGADCILLIVAALSDEELKHLYETAELCQLDALVEVHTLGELERALEINPRIIGINNRDLTTFQVDLATTEKLSEEVPHETLLISESGIKTREDVQRAFDSGCDAILVGETLMRSMGGAGIPETIRDLLSIRVEED